MSKAERSVARPVYRVSMIGWGLAGIYYHGVCDGNTTSTSCPEYATTWLARLASGEFYSAEYVASHHNPVDFAGAWVLDKRDAIYRDLGLVFEAPLDDPQMPPMAMRAWEGPVIEVATLEDIKSGVDYVGTELYVAWWRRAGARVGRVNADGRTIAWEEQPAH